VRRLVDLAVRDRPEDQALNRFPPVVLVLVAICSLQFGAALGVTLFDDVGPTGAAAVRLVFAAAILLAVWRPRPRAHTREALRVALAFGLVLGTMNWTIYLALDRIPVGIAITLEFLGPLGVAIAASRTRLDLLWAALDALGVVFALTAGALWAAYIVLAQHAGRHFSGGTGLAIAMGVAALVPLVPGIATGGAALLAPEVLAVGALVALASSVVPYSLEVEALRRMRRGVFGVLMSFEPAAAALAGFLVLSQDLGVRELVAIALVVAASAGATRAPLPDPA
jgi:inner membrane transporter RhtA